MTLKIAVLEDEIFFYNQLSALISNWAERNRIKVQCKSFLNEEAFLNFMQNSIAFDAVFMDIFLNNTNGIELANKLRKYNSSLPIVFATATSDYLREGYEVQAIGYMIKPFEQAKVDKCMNRILHLSERPCYRDFSYRSDGIVHVIPFNSILYFQCSDHFINAHCAYEIHTFHEKISMLQQGLPPEFLRCNRNTIINLNYLFSFTSHEIKLTDQTCFPVSRNYEKNVKTKCFQHFTNEKAVYATGKANHLTADSL